MLNSGYESLSDGRDDVRLFVQDNQPASGETKEGYLWSKTSATNALQRATDASTFVTVEGAGAHAGDHADGGGDELAVQDLASDAATDGQVAKADGVGAVVFEDDKVVINFIIDGGGSTITTGKKGYVEIPFAMTIEGVTMLADQSGSIVVDIWKDTFANFPPLDGDSITASAVPTISAAVKSQDLTLTGWTTAVVAGDVVGFNVDSITTIQRVTIALRGKKT